MRTQLLLLAAVVTFLWPACTQAEIVYEVIDLGTVTAHSINDAGQIVGRAENDHGLVHATLFDPTGAGDNIDLGTLGGDSSHAYSINETGQIVGDAFGPDAPPRPPGPSLLKWLRATLFDPTGAANNIDLGTGTAYSINDAGQIVGGEHFGRAILFDPTGAGNNIDLGTLGGDSSAALSINDAGEIVGSARNSEGDGRATLFDPTGAGNNIDLGTLGGGRSKAYSINNAGQIVGRAENDQGLLHATLFDSTGARDNIDLGALPGYAESSAYSINDAGQIVGLAYDSQGDRRATLFDTTGAGDNIDLNTLIDPASGWTLRGATDINNSGCIVGEGINPQGEPHAFLLIPEPATFALLGLGILCLRRRRSL